jgi:hypothetical protein
MLLGHVLIAFIVRRFLKLHTLKMPLQKLLIENTTFAEYITTVTHHSNDMDIETCLLWDTVLTAAIIFVFDFFSTDSYFSI